ncbi:unnamed protein product [Schistosoma curassoni]|uniref:Uncharacterized protein n=1 Tax=Schistosoma curassoni TaxID=6186 RepID=A0A183JTD8_9TREM|nr:unnamed protein product [Schistosoma curassoni]
MSSQRIPRRALFGDAVTGWKERRGGQCMKWCRGMKESCKELASVGPSRLPGWARDVIRYGSEWKPVAILL